MRALLVLSLCSCAYLRPGVGSRVGDLGRITWEDPHGILVAENGHPVDRAVFSAMVEGTIVAWETAFPHENIRRIFDPWWIGSTRTVVLFRPFPFTDPGCGVIFHFQCKGLTHGHEVSVGFDQNEAGALWPRVLSHELGHVVMFDLGLPGWNDEETFKRLAAEKHLPY